MVFEKELAILYGFFNVRISKKTTLLQKTFFLIFIYFDFMSKCI